MSPRGTPILRHVAAAVAVALLAACASTGAPRAVAIGTDVRLDAGRRVALPDRSTLVYRGLAEDSRCPRSVHCIHAGSVRVLFEYDAGHGPTAAHVEAPRHTSAPLGSVWRLTVTDVAGATPASVDVRIDRSP
jgi:hypothetical protein